jgi:hypothetical protein
VRAPPAPTGSVRLRAAAARRLGSDLPGAVAEDVLAAVLGRTAARTR